MSLWTFITLISSHSKRLSRSWDPLNLPRLKLHCSHKPKGRIDKSLKFPTIRELKKTAPIWFGFFLPGWCRMTNLAWCQVVRKAQVPETRESFKAWSNDWLKSSLKVFSFFLSLFLVSLFSSFSSCSSKPTTTYVVTKIYDIKFWTGAITPRRRRRRRSPPLQTRGTRVRIPTAAWCSSRAWPASGVSWKRRPCRRRPAEVTRALRTSHVKNKVFSPANLHYPHTPHFTVLKNFSRKLCCCLNLWWPSLLRSF